MPKISIVITTLNEEANIERALTSARLLSDDVLVIDSGSKDGTLAIVSRLGARSMHRPFDDMAEQRNAALLHVSGDYAMILDADEMITAPFASALRSLLEADPAIDGVRVCRRFHFWGKWLPAASDFPRYIDRVVRVGTVRFVKRGHGEAFSGGSRYVELAEPLHDEDLKPIRAWIDRHNAYAANEAAQDLALRRGEAPGTRWRAWRARARRVPGWPVVALGYYLIVRRGLFEGPRGWTYCCMKAMFEYFVQLHTIDLRRRR